MNSQLLSLLISYRSSGEKLIKYQANSSCVIMFVILITTLFYKALKLQREIWCWSLLGLKGLRVTLGIPASSRWMEVGRSIENRPKLAESLAQTSLYFETNVQRGGVNIFTGPQLVATFCLILYFPLSFS